MDYLTLRFACAFFTGIILSQTGSLIQLSTRNILASPSTLGFDGLSVLWMLIFHSLLLGIGVEQGSVEVFLFGLPLFFVVGFFFSRFMLWQNKIEKLIFIGLAFNLLVGAIFSLWQFMFLAFNLPFPVELWFGHFRYSEMSSALILLFTELCILAGWLFLRRDFEVFSLGHSISRNLKIKKNLLFLFLFISIAAGTFAVVALFGAFSFLGLIFPIVARKFWFYRYDLAGELIYGAVMNGLFMIFIDSICYFFPIYGAEIPVGLIATGVGALSLILLLWKSDQIVAKTEK